MSDWCSTKHKRNESQLRSWTELQIRCGIGNELVLLRIKNGKIEGRKVERVYESIGSQGSWRPAPQTPLAPRAVSPSARPAGRHHSLDALAAGSRRRTRARAAGAGTGSVGAWLQRRRSFRPGRLRHADRTAERRALPARRVPTHNTPRPQTSDSV